MERPLNIIEDCFIRENKKCGRVLNGSKMAFIATPATDYVQLELEIIKSHLKAFEIEPYIAVEHRAFGKDIFCEKICGKIIESLFCILVLNDKVENIGDKSISVPNSNVYYEYGMMTTLNKRIIPLQKKDQDLSFNIQSLDTVKYTEGSFSSDIESAISAIFVEEGKLEESPTGALSDELMVYLGLNGLVWPQIPKDSDFETAVLVGSGLGFLLFADFMNYQTCYLKIVQNDKEERDVHIYVKALNKRLEALATNIWRHIDFAEGAEYTEGKRSVNEAIATQPENKTQVKVLRYNLKLFGNPKIYVYRETFSDKDHVLESAKKFESKVLRPELILLDKAEILTFIEAETK
jgi:hypothetical protein